MMMALVSSFSLNSCAANLSTAVKGAPSGTLILLGSEARDGMGGQPLHGPPVVWLEIRLWAAGMPSAYTRYGSFGSEVSVILNVTLPSEALRPGVRGGHGTGSPGSAAEKRCAPGLAACDRHLASPSCARWARAHR